MSLLLSKNTIAKIGEDMPLSEEFINVINLNTLCHNFPIFDIIATHKKDGQTYVFSAKARKKYGQNGKINPSYNILSGKNIALKYKKALDLLETFGYFDVHCCFLICPIQNGNNISYYYGKFTLINPFTKTEKVMALPSYTYYADGVGLVEWKSNGNKVHFKLEQIMDQADWLKFIRP